RLTGVEAARAGGHGVGRGPEGGPARRRRLPRAGAGRWGVAVVVQQLPRPHDGPDLPGLVDRAGRRRARGLQRGAAARLPGPPRTRRVPDVARLLEPDAAELAVGVPGDPVHGTAVDLPAAARLTGVEAGRWRALRDGRRRLTGKRVVTGR